MPGIDTKGPIVDRALTVHQLAHLVKQLRIVQKGSGVGYKTPAASTVASALERKVDAAIARIIGA